MAEANRFPVRVFSPGEEAAIANALDRPFSAVLEVGDGRAPPQGCFANILARDGQLVSVETKTAYGLDLADRFCRALEARLVLAPELCEAIELCLQEAVSNAIVHGNLQIGSSERASREALVRFSVRLEERLADRSFARRRIHVACAWDQDKVEVLVGDEGPGFDSASLSPQPGQTDPGGRGIEIIRWLSQEVEFLDHGRVIAMRFARRQA